MTLFNPRTPDNLTSPPESISMATKKDVATSQSVEDDPLSNLVKTLDKWSRIRGSQMKKLEEKEELLQKLSTSEVSLDTSQLLSMLARIQSSDFDESSAVKDAIQRLKGDIGKRDERYFTTVYKLVSEVLKLMKEDIALHRVCEYFATALLPHWKLLRGTPVYGEHCGGPNDKGADVLLCSSSDERIKVVVQVKGGQYFHTGKGNSIVLSLIGSCVYYGVTKGIIFSSESAEKLTGNTKRLIEILGMRGYRIECLFIEDIQDCVEQLDYHAKVAVLRRLHKLLKRQRHKRDT